MSKCDDILSLQFFNLEVNDFEAKVVLKPLDYDRKWKFQYKPINGDIQLLSKKIPVTKFLNLQVLFFCRILLIGILFCDRRQPATLYYWYILASKVHHRSAVSSQSLNMQIDCLGPQTYSSRLSWSSNLFGCVISLPKLRNHSFSSSNLFSYVIPVPKLGFESFLGQNNTI